MFTPMTEKQKAAQQRFIDANPGILKDPNTGFAPNGAING
jgi:hypothetical protein